jgi:hypothetical protein
MQGFWLNSVRVAIVLMPLFSWANTPISAQVSWVVDSDSGEDALRGFVEYTIQPDTPVCQSIRLIQAARIETAPGINLNWQSGESNRNLIRTVADPSKAILAGFYIDHDAAACSPGKACSPYFRDSWANPAESHDGKKTQNTSVNASMIDYPFGWSSFQTITLESCAQCVDNAQFLGCVQWGGDWPAGGRSLLPVIYEAQPSATFLSALELFKKFY